MARPTLDYDTRTKTARTRLEPREKPYYRQIGPGRALGYMRMNHGAGRWVVREWLGGRYRTRWFGHADDVVRADGTDVLTFEQATRSALAPQASAPVGRLTVREALTRYFVGFAARSKHAKITEQWANLRIVPTLGDFRVDRLTKTEIERWLAGLVRNDPEDPDARRRSQDTANRILSILKAALNEAFADEANGLPSDTAWRRVKRYRNVGGARQEHFEASQVRLLVAKATTFDHCFADLVEVAYLIGARLGELANANVRDFDAENGALRVTGKTGTRSITLTSESIATLRRVAGKRPPPAPLLPRLDGERWRNTQHRPMQRALKLAKLSADASFYSLRHSHISRAIEGEMPLSLIAENCGTSLLMIQKNYAKVLTRTRRDVIQQTAPKLRRVK
jgi:integrase